MGLFSPDYETFGWFKNPIYRKWKINITHLNLVIGDKEVYKSDIKNLLIKYKEATANYGSRDYFKCVENIQDFIYHYFCGDCFTMASKGVRIGEKIEYLDWLERGEYKGKIEQDDIINALTQLLAWIEYKEIQQRKELAHAKSEYARTKAEYEAIIKKNDDRVMNERNTPIDIFFNIVRLLFLLALFPLAYYACGTLTGKL
jgi:hypothetical protein